MSDTGNHQWYNAVAVTGSGSWSSTLDSTGTDYAVPETNPTSYSLGGQRAAWYVLTPGAAGDVTFTATPQTFGAEVDLFSYDSRNGWLLYDAVVAGPGQPRALVHTLTLDKTWYYRIANNASDGQLVALSATGAPIAGGVAGPASLAVTGADLAGAGDTAGVTATGGLARSVVEDAGATDTVLLAAPVGADVPVVAVGVDAPAPVPLAAAVSLVSPADGSSLASLRPALTAAITTADPGVDVQVQLARSLDYAGALSITVPGVAGLDDAAVSAYPDADLDDDGVYCWRARALGAYGAGPWSDSFIFAVQAVQGQAVAAATCTVTPAAGTVPHLWYLDPASAGVPGGVAYAVGAGFGPAPTVMLGDTGCALVQAEAVPADPDAGALIDPDTVVSVYHERVAFTVPDGYDPDADGDAVTVVQGGM